jgi:hypothetical protein
MHANKYNNKNITHEGITFKSILEKRAYQLYKEAGFTPQYEPDIFTIWDKHVLSDNVFIFKPYKKSLNKSKRTLLAITYTPDFIFEFKGNLIIVDTKGQPNDTYPLKLKMFLKFCDEKLDKKVYFFEPHNIGQIKQSIEIIKQLPYHK